MFVFVLGFVLCSCFFEKRLGDFYVSPSLFVQRIIFVVVLNVLLLVVNVHG